MVLNLNIHVVSPALILVRIVNLKFPRKAFHIVLYQGRGFIHALHLAQAHFGHRVAVFIAFPIHMASVFAHVYIIFRT